MHLRQSISLKALPCLLLSSLFSAHTALAPDPGDALEYQQMHFLSDKASADISSLRAPIKMLADPNVTVLGINDAHQSQQHTLTSLNGWQYAVFSAANAPSGDDVATSDFGNAMPRWINVARRKSAAPEWEMFTLKASQYDERSNVALGICEGDGTLFLAYKDEGGVMWQSSKKGLATRPEEFQWEDDFFDDVEDTMFGLMRSDLALFEHARDPNFLSVDDDLLLETRISDGHVLSRYRPTEGIWQHVGEYLVGKQGCNLVLGGMSITAWGKLFVSWTNQCMRNNDEQEHTQQRLENANVLKEDKHLRFAMSADDGETWTSGKENLITNEKMEERMRRYIEGLPARDEGEDGLLAQLEPGQGSGIDCTSSEAIVDSEERDDEQMTIDSQCVGGRDDFHMLVRGSVAGAGGRKRMWKHYRRVGISGRWIERDTIDLEGLAPAQNGGKGKLLCMGTTALFFVLPIDDALYIVKRQVVWDGQVNYGPSQIVWKGEQYDGDPQVDMNAASRHSNSNSLSIMTRMKKEREVVVLDFKLSQKDLECDRRPINWYGADPNAFD